MTHPVKLISTVTLISGGRVLLVKYNDMPDHQRGWFLPHDLLNALEHPADAAARALREQLAIDGATVKLKDVESFKGRDGTWHMSFHFLAEASSAPALKLSPDIAAAEWFDRSSLPARDEVAHHGWAIDTIKTVLSS